MPVSVDIVLPCYNPNDVWSAQLKGFHHFVNNRYQLNYILVNDGSYNGKIEGQISQLEKENIPINFISYPINKGKGYALREGVEKAKSEFVIYTDIDFPFTNESTFSLIEELVKQKEDVVAGYRNQEYYQKKMSTFRKSLSKLFRFFIKNILKMTVSDTQCGLKGFNAKGKKNFLATKINRYLFDFEFIYFSSKDKTVSIKALPVQLKDDVVFSKMKLKVLVQESFNLLYVLLFRKS
jgi:glycosyltransferase involved in cell wall biosynthesis